MNEEDSPNLVEASVRDGEAVRLVPVHARDLDGHVAGATHRHAVAPRREQQELLLQLLAVRLQNLQDIWSGIQKHFGRQSSWAG